jgi:predicted peroxiredoxin
MRDGEILEIVSDIFEPFENDLAAWCRMTGRELIDMNRQADYLRFYIRKLPRREGQAFAIVISDNGLEELLSPLGFAQAAALSGMKTHIYIQGPAVRIMKRHFKAKLHGWMRPFSKFARDGLAAVGHLPPEEKLQQLRELGAKIYLCGPSMKHFGVEREDLIFDDVTVCEYLTFLEIMRQADVQLMVQ